jgi:hypothetical protein
LNYQDLTEAAPEEDEAQTICALLHQGGYADVLGALHILLHRMAENELMQVNRKYLQIRDKFTGRGTGIPSSAVDFDLRY